MTAIERSMIKYHFAQGWRDAGEQARGRQTRHSVDPIGQNERYWRAGLIAGKLAFESLSEHYADLQADEELAALGPDEWKRFVEQHLQLDLQRETAKAKRVRQADRQKQKTIKTTRGDIWEHYPAGWPACSAGCGKPALDGHYTCGSLTCSEAAARCRNPL